MSQKTLTNLRIKEIWKKFLLNKPERDYLTLYLSIPICFEKCSFCIYYRYPYLSKSKLDHYLDYIEDEAIFFSDIFKNIEFKAFYIGGGTPSLLKTEQILRLFSILKDNFKIKTTNANFCCFEAHPAYFNKTKIDAILQDGMVNRISFGIQSFNRDIVEQSNRIFVPVEKFKKLVQYITKEYQNKKINLNVDLMIGLEKENIESLFFSFSKLAELNMLRITVYCNRKEGRKYGDTFRKRAVRIIRLLDDYIEQNHPQYTKLFKNLNEYNEVYAWALKGYKYHLFKYSYNSSPIAYNNNFGIGMGSDSYIIKDNIFYHNSNGKYILNDMEASKIFMKRANLIRMDDKDYLNYFNF